MASFSFTIPSTQPNKNVTLVSQDGNRRWMFPAMPPEAEHQFPTVSFDLVTRPDNNPANVITGKNLHRITFDWILAYEDGRSVEVDLQQLRGFASSGQWFTIDYTPSWGGWWLIVEPLSVKQTMLNRDNEITQATVSLVLRRATMIVLELAPIKADNASDVPIIKTVEVAGSPGADDGLNKNTVQVGGSPESGGGASAGGGTGGGPGGYTGPEDPSRG